MVLGTVSDKSYHIVFIGHSVDAIKNFRLPLIFDLLYSGWRVTLLAPDWDKSSSLYFESLGVSTISFPFARTGLSPIKDLKTLLILFRWLRRVNPNVVFTFAAKTNIWGILAASAAGIRWRVAMVEGLGYAFVKSSNGYDSLKRYLIGRLLRLLYSISFRFASKVVILNSDDFSDLARWCRLPEEKGVLLGGIGVPLDEWQLCSPVFNPVTFTFVGRLLREKGILDFLSAAVILKKIYPCTQFIVLGALDENPGGIKEEDLRPYLTQGVVTWPGLVDVKPWLAKTSVFVLPSYYREGVPRSAQEAAAMGRPIITTDSPGCRETVIHGVNGWLVPPRNVNALIAAMRFFVDRPEEIEKMGRRSRNLAEEKFDVRRANGLLMDVLTPGE